MAIVQPLFTMERRQPVPAGQRVLDLAMVAGLEDDPLVNVNRKLWKISSFDRNTHYKWPVSLRENGGLMGFNYGNSPFFMRKSIISMAIFNSKMLNFQRVTVERLV